MGCGIPHQSNAVNISHQTNAGLRVEIAVERTQRGLTFT